MQKIDGFAKHGEKKKKKVSPHELKVSFNIFQVKSKGSCKNTQLRYKCVCVGVGVICMYYTQTLSENVFIVFRQILTLQLKELVC